MPEAYRRESGSWLDRKRRERGRRALIRQLEYQEAKAHAFREDTDNLVRANFLRAQLIRQRLTTGAGLADDAKVLEVGSGAHGLIFGFGASIGVGVDPLAVDYKRLFPALQKQAMTIAAIGEELPFADKAFDVVLSDNVIDHAERPLAIIDELIRVLRPGGILYFTVNIHHPVYDLASRLHGAWNALGIRLELSAFADHTIHLTETRITNAFRDKPLDVIEQRSTVAQTKIEHRNSKIANPDALLKKLFFKNALFELIAKKTDK
jgi:SAM-dependent methyltransferase